LPYGAQISNAIDRAWLLTQDDEDRISGAPVPPHFRGASYTHLWATAVMFLLRDEPTRLAWARANTRFADIMNANVYRVFTAAALGFAVLPYPEAPRHATNLLIPYMAHIHRTTDPVEVKA
jgi:hypothetical protein